MEKGDFLKDCKAKGYSDKDITKFSKALSFAEEHFGSDQRISGGLVSYHNLMVGKVLVDIAASPECVTAGLLHGLLKYKKEVQEEFGQTILDLIVGVAQIKDLKNKNQTLQAEAIRNVLVTTMTDVRVIIIKLANEVENFRNIDKLSKERQKIISQQAMEIYAPLAYRIGHERLRVQLENLAFRISNPKKYAEIDNFLKASQEQREKQISEAIDLIKSMLRGKVTVLSMKGRPKHIYSIYRKMNFRGVGLEQQNDLLGIRIIVPDEKDCYTTLALLHEKLEPVDGRLKDYIARPKQNMYRSIHTGVKLPSGKIVEVQVRTQQMDELAEEGLAAHWKYKQMKSEDAFEKRVGWLKQVLTLGKNEGSKEFLETTKVDVFGDRIYCYTPKGDVKDLPVGATVLDFAFLVHEHVGSKAVAARINGKFVPLKQELTKGDVVEILTNKNQRPHRNWLKIVKTTNARQKIRKSLKIHEKLPALHYKILKVQVSNEERAYLVESEEFSNAVCLLAKCCKPVPGDDIIGIPTKRRVISVHSEDCKQALKEESRWVEVSWKESFSQKIRFYVNAKERSGLLADILNTIATAGFQVSEAKAKLTGPEDMECSFLVVPRSLETLIEMIRRVRKVKGVRRISFE